MLITYSETVIFGGNGKYLPLSAQIKDPMQVNRNLEISKALI